MDHSNYNTHLLKQIIPLYFWEPLNRDFSGRQESIKGIVKLILLNIVMAIRHFREIRRYKIPTLKEEIILCYNDNPKKDVLSSLKTQLKNKTEIGPSPSFLENKEFSELYFGYLGLRYSFHHIFWYYSFKGYERRAYRNKFWHCYYDLGKYRFMLKQFKQSNIIKCFIGTNDHIGYSQIGFVAAQKIGVKTVYVQHAAVTDKFPPLIVDLALLDGQDAKEKYRIAPNRKVQIELIGSLKYDLAFKSTEINTNTNVVGICVNMFQNEQILIIDLCNKLEKENIPFIVRFHPHLQEKEISPAFKSNWNYSNSNIESETDFIFKCGTIISGDSSILLDTIALHRRPIYFTQSQKVSDYYGFLKNGLITKKFNSASDVLNELSKETYSITEQRNKAKHYIESINSSFEGKSTELAIKHLQNLANFSDSNFQSDDKTEFKL